MLFYVVIIASATLFAVMANNEKSKHKIVSDILFIISALILFVPLAMRDCGVDYEEYYRTYLSTASRTWQNYWRLYIGRPEPLYSVLNYFAYWIFDSYQGVHFLCALLSIGFSYAGIYKFKDKIGLGVAVWSIGFNYYLMMYGLNRMMLAVSIITWAYHYWIDKKTFKFIVWTIIAGLFHYSAFLMIPLYFLLLWISSKKGIFHELKWGRVIVVVALIFVVIYRVVPVVFGSFPWFVRYQQYFILSTTFEALNNNIQTYPTVIFALLYHKTIENYLEDKKLLYMLYIYVMLCVVSVIMPVHRICYFFYPCIVLLNGVLPRALYVSSGKTERSSGNSLMFLGLMTVVGLFAIWLITCYGIHWAPYINPYKMGSF